jgi:septal ring factor EnvC (AmiA/AmiB activator)
MVGRIGATVVVLFVLPTILVSLAEVHRASADSISSVQASIAAQEAKITVQSQTIHQLTTAYQQATLQSATLRQEVTTDGHSLQRVRAAVASSQSDLRQAAVRAYTDGLNTAPAVLRVNPAVGSEYLTVASGDVKETVDQLNLQQRQVRTDEVQLGQEQAANRVAIDQAAKARSQALAAAKEEQNQLDGLQSRLQQLQAEAAAAAAAQAQAAAAAQAKAAATQGVPVNNGLLTSVQSQVSPTPPSTTTAAPAPWAAAPPAASPVSGSLANDLAGLRQCESSGNYATNTGNGFYGAYQFSQQTWTNLGYPGRPDLEPPGMQDQAAAQLATTVGWSQWPACSAELGLSGVA